jgi:hypothetical protein
MIVIIVNINTMLPKVAGCISLKINEILFREISINNTAKAIEKKIVVCLDFNSYFNVLYCSLMFGC